MSIIRETKSDLLGDLRMEIYNSANELVDDLQKRKKTSSLFTKNEYDNKSWVGATREEAYKMLREGYQPTVDAVKGQLKVRATEKRFRRFDDVAGFAPIVPNAILGLPKSMINSSMLPINAKVIDVYYDMTVFGDCTSKDLIKVGQKILGTILALEHQGYRFNLYTVIGYSDSDGCDMVCVKVKTASQPFDLKRMSFTTTHTAFFRGIGFEWYAKFPRGRYRSGYGIPICNKRHGADKVRKEFKKLFGRSAIYLSAAELIESEEDADDLIKGALTNDKTP